VSTDQPLIKLSGLRDGQLRRMMIGFIYEMTLIGRGAYAARGEGLEAPQRLREINEIVHRTADALARLEGGDRALALELLASQLEEPDLTGAAFDRAMKHVDAAVVAADAHSGV
jgi:hypothetical protein